jgi:signal transduction histidine kinase
MGTGNGRPDPQPPRSATVIGRPGSASPHRDDGVDGVRGPPDEVLTFPLLRRMELDELLAQLVGRAQEVMGTQGRLRGLLRANQLIAQDLGLPTVLRHVAEAARELVGARYAALGVIAPSGGLAQFVHVGMPAEAAAAIGHLPQGKGLLGALIEDPDPIRLPTLAEDTRSCGFPPGHPPMQGFLGVPIRIGEVVFGNLYLTESTRGGFSAEDEQLAQALAATAGTAIDNARLYEVARSRQHWWQATAALTRRMLTGETGDPLEFIAARSRELADADLVTVVLPADAQHGPDETGLRVQVAVGVGGQDLTGLAVPLAGSLAGRVYATGQPLRVSHPSEQPGLASIASGTVDVGPVLVVPLTASQKVIGVLTVARLTGRAAFTTDELDMAAGFANQASVAIELAAARTEQQRCAMDDERDRIAADLHDHVIQRLFATGLALQSIAATLPSDTRGSGAGAAAAARITGTIQDLDDTISQIRSTIFALHHLAQPADSGLRGQILDVIAQLTPALGFTPALRVDGPVDALTPIEVGEDLLAVLREALSNIARHAHAHTSDIKITAGSGRLTLDVHDDGTGIDPSNQRCSGLANLRHRAEHHSGAFTLTPRHTGGTTLCWTVPL